MMNTYRKGDRVLYLGHHPHYKGMEGIIVGPREDRPPGQAWCVAFDFGKARRRGEQIEAAFCTSKNLMLVEEATPDSIGAVTMELAGAKS